LRADAGQFVIHGQIARSALGELAYQGGLAGLTRSGQQDDRRVLHRFGNAMLDLARVKGRRTHALIMS